MSDNAGVAANRLIEERRKWRKEHPFGFVAKPITNSDNSLNWMDWDCIIPGKRGTPWEGGSYKLWMRFTDEYPNTPPKCKFIPPLFHPNIFLSGRVNLPLLDVTKDWRPDVTIKEILLKIQDILDQPNARHLGRLKAWELYCKNPFEYNKRIRTQARAMNYESTRMVEEQIQ